MIKFKATGKWYNEAAESETGISDIQAGLINNRSNTMTDTFRKEYRPLLEENSKLIREMKEACEKVEALYRRINSREMSLALTNLEQASMWATKAVVLFDEKTQQEQTKAV